MLPSVAIKAFQVRRSGIAPLNLRLFAVVMFVSFFAVLPTSAYAESYYSDSWIHDYNADAGEIVGCGVTRAEYDEDYHLVSVDTTITSPNGRSDTAFGIASGAQYKRPYIARAEPHLAWSWTDVGDYTVDSHHYSDCPETDFGITSNVIRIGVSTAVYSAAQCHSDGCLYSITDNCDTSCKPPTIKVKSPSLCHSYAIRKTGYEEVFGIIVCAHIAATTEVSATPGLCFDLDLYP